MTDLFYQLEWHGKKVVKEVYRKEEIYKGKYVNRAPDLVLMPQKGFNFRARLFRKKLFDSDSGLTGKHTQDDAFLYVKGSRADEIVPEDPSVEDILPLIGSLGGMRIEGA